MRRILLLSLFILWVFSPTVLDATEQIAVIVAKTQGSASLSRTDLARIYERRRRFWHDGAKIVPINLPADHPVRKHFSLQVFEKSPEDMQEYWDIQYFHGVLPPYVLASEQAVLEFVANTPGAIGYVKSSILNGQVAVVMYLPFSSTP